MGDVNIAINRPASASSSIDPYFPARAVNGKCADPADRWLCTQLPGWLCVDLGSSIYFNRWVVRNLQISGWPQNYNMKAYSLQISEDKANWITVDNSIANNTSSCTDRTIPPVKGRYARVYINTGGGLLANPNYASIAEFELYQTPTPSTLSALSLSANGANVPLSTPFASNVTSYNASVPFSTNTISVTPTATDPNSTVKVNGTVVSRGQSTNVQLNTGVNTVSVVVTPIIGTPMTYTVNVTREHSTYLSNLALQSGTTSIPIKPDFNKTTGGYTASVNIDTASVTVTPTAEDSSAVITVNGTTVTSGGTSNPISLNAGTNSISVVVTAQGVTQQAYTVTVTKEDLYISALSIVNGRTTIGLVPGFDKTKNTYTGSTNKTTSLLVTATAEAPNDVTLAINNLTATSAKAVSVPVTWGQTNHISIVVTSKATGATNTYICDINVSA